MDNILEKYRPTLEEGVGLPGEAFTSEAFFEAERQKVFVAGWACIGLSDDVPKPGDIKPVDFMGYPLLLVRDKEGVLRVFHNACPHRGATLADEPRNCRGKLVCPYHGWTFELKGDLVRSPNVGGAMIHTYQDIDHSELGLREVRSSVWGPGLIYVNVDGKAESFEDFIRPTAERLLVKDFSIFRRDTERQTQFNFDSNWKIVAENFVESYHLPSVHRDLEKVNPMSNHFQILGGHSYIGQGGSDYADFAETVSKTEYGLPQYPGMDSSRYEVHYVYSNVIMIPLVNTTFFLILNPQSAAKTTERLEAFYYTEEALSPELEADREEAVRFMSQVNNEDIGICERAQAGRYSPSFTGGQFCKPQEATSLHLQRLIAAKMLIKDGQRSEELIDLPVEDIHHPHNQ